MPIRPIKTPGRTLAALALVLGSVAAPAAAPPECTCRHLASLQADYRNAVALEAYFRGLAQHLTAIEAEAMEDWQDPGRVRKISRDEDAAYRKQNPPGNVMEPVPGYTGPAHVDMPSGTCAQAEADLEALESGATCRAIAEAALNHEASHRKICNQMGAKAYWARPSSDLAREEAEAYRVHAAELKAALRRVLEDAEITFKAAWDIEMNVQGVAQYGYRYTASTEDIGGATGGDTWTMTGAGTSTVAFTKASIMGMKCTPTGAAKSTYTAKMTTDGLTFSLALEDPATQGALGIKCPRGGGGGPVAEGAQEGGLIAKNRPLSAGDNLLPGDMASEMAAILAGNATVSGDGRRVLSVTCGP